MKNQLLFLFLLCIPVHALQIPGLYRCEEVRVSRTIGNKVLKKGFRTPSLILNFKPGILTLTGNQSDYYLSESFTIRTVSKDTLIAEVKHKDKKEPVTMAFSGDTLTIDFSFENDEGKTVRINAKLLIKPVQNTGNNNRKPNRVRPESPYSTRTNKRDLMGR